MPGKILLRFDKLEFVDKGLGLEIAAAAFFSHVANLEFEGEGVGNKTVAVALNIAWFMENHYAVAPLIPNP